MLTAQASELTDTLTQVARDGWSHVVLDGKVISGDRCAAPTTSRTGQATNAW